MNLIVAIKQLSNLDHAVPFQFSKEKWQVIFPNSEPPKIDDPTDLYEFEDILEQHDKNIYQDSKNKTYNSWEFSEEINCIEVLLTEGESIKITNLEIGKKLKNPFFDHIEFRTNNRFVYCIFEFAIGQAGGLGIWDAKIKEWCFWFSDELFCLSELSFNEEHDLFHGKCSFSYPMSPFGGTVDFEINSKRELKSKSYKYIGVDGKEVIGIGKFFDKET